MNMKEQLFDTNVSVFTQTEPRFSLLMIFGSKSLLQVISVITIKAPEEKICKNILISV